MNVVLAMEAWKLFLSWSESVFFHGSLNVDVACIILRHYVSTQDVHLYTTFSLCRRCNRLSIVCVSYSPLSGVIVNGVMYVNSQRPYLVYTNIDMWTITLIRTTVKYSYRCDRYNTSKWVSLECRGCLSDSIVRRSVHFVTSWHLSYKSTNIEDQYGCGFKA